MITARIALLGGLLAAAFALLPLPAAAQEKLRIMLDTNPAHVRNKGVEISRTPLAQVVRGTMPFVGLMLSLLVLITYVPVFSTWLPGLLLSK